MTQVAALHPLLSTSSRSLFLSECINKDAKSLENHIKVAVTLADNLIAPPAIDVALFWKSISTSLTTIDTLERADNENCRHELNCLLNKLEEVLGDAVFNCPEEATLKRAFNEIGSTAAVLSTSSRFSHELLIELLTSICVLAKYERKPSSELFNKSILNLVKLFISLDFPKPVSKRLGSIIADAYTSQRLGSEFSSMLPLILLTLLNTLPNLTSPEVVMGVFVPVLDCLGSTSLGFEQREAVDDLCWKILAKLFVNKSTESLSEEFAETLTEFVVHQRASLVEQQLEPLLTFFIRLKCKTALVKLCSLFLSVGRPEFLFAAFLAHTDKNSWLLQLLGEWLKSNVSLTTPAFSLLWKFILSKASTSKSALYLLCKLLSGFQAFGCHQSVLPSVETTFLEFCSETVTLLSSVQSNDVLKLDCLTCVAVMVTLCEIEFSKVIPSDFSEQCEKARKLLKKQLINCMNDDDQSNKQSVVNGLVAMCQLDSKNVKRLHLFLTNEANDNNFDVNKVVDYYLKHYEMAPSNELLFSIVDRWLDGSVESDRAGHSLLSIICLFNDRNCLNEYISRCDNDILIKLLSTQKSLNLMPSLPLSVRSQLLEIALSKAVDFDHASGCCPLLLVNCLLVKESDFSTHSVFSKCGVVEFFKLLEDHIGSDEKIVVNLLKMACNAVVTSPSDLSKFLKKYIKKRLTSHTPSIIVCHCLHNFFRKLRNLRGNMHFENFLSEMNDESDIFSLENYEKIFEEDGSQKRCLVLTTLLLSLLDWKKFGEKRVSIDWIESCSRVLSCLGGFERSLWSTTLMELLSRCVKATETVEELNEVGGILLSGVFDAVEYESPPFIAVWQNVFKKASTEAGNLLRYLVFVNLSTLDDALTSQPPCLDMKFCPLFTAYLNVLISACNNEEHTEEDHENAVWNVGDDAASCTAVDMAAGLYECVVSHPVVGVFCLPVASKFGFFNKDSHGLLSVDLLLAIAVACARSTRLLSSSCDYYAKYCNLLSSLLRLRPLQNSSDSQQPVRLSNIIHIILYCLSAALSTLLEFPLPQSEISVFFQEASRLFAMASHRKRLLNDCVVHVIATTLVSAVKSPLSVGFAGLPPVHRKQVVCIVVQLFHLCSEKALKSMSLLLPPECLPLLKSVRSEAFVQKKARRKV